MRENGGHYGAIVHPTLGAILHIKQPRHPEFRFEWHPNSKKVYVIRIGVSPEVGEILAFDIDTHGGAINAVLIWTRGYAAAQVNFNPSEQYHGSRQNH